MREPYIVQDLMGASYRYLGRLCRDSVTPLRAWPRARPGRQPIWNHCPSGKGGECGKPAPDYCPPWDLHQP